MDSMKTYIKIKSFKLYSPKLERLIADSKRGKGKLERNQRYNDYKLRAFKPIVLAK